MVLFISVCFGIIGVIAVVGVGFLVHDHFEGKKLEQVFLDRQKNQMS